MMSTLRSAWLLALFVVALIGCGGGAGSTDETPVLALPASPQIATTLSSTSIDAANPATVTVTLTDGKGVPAAGQVVTFSVVRGLAVTNVATALTDAAGQAKVALSPASSTTAGADEVTARATYAGIQVQSTVGFQIKATEVAVSTGPVLTTRLSSTSISSAVPAVVTSTLVDGTGSPVAGQVVTFSVVRNLAVTNVATALTNASGQASVILSPVNSTTAGADELTAKASLAGAALQSTVGFQVQATNVALASFASAVPSLSAYGQTTLTVGLSGASVGSPVNVSVTSSCVSLGKATLSPATFTATTGTVDLQYKDNGCGALQSQDKLQAAVTGGTNTPVSLSLPIVSPAAASMAFVAASPEIIYLKGSGFTETATLTFEVRDSAGSVLPNLPVVLDLLTEAGGLTMQNASRDPKTQLLTVGPVTSDANGRVTTRVSSGTVPTPVRVRASLGGANAGVATVSSNLSVAVGLPSQVNFSLSQQTLNIEGFNRDGATNTYTVIMSDRNGNPVPTGTSVNFVAEGGQIEAIARSATVATSGTGSGTGLSSATVNFQSSSPRPADGRITVTAYALGEESFLDLNGNNTYDAGEPFQDLGNVFKDRLFDGAFDAASDEYVSTGIASASACAASGNALLALDTGIPSAPGTCDGVWSGAGKVYVRRAAETVLSTSAARPLWASTAGLDASCSAITLQTGPATATTSSFRRVHGGESWYTGGATSLSTTLPFIVGDANTFPTPSASGAVGRLNPVAAGSTITATTPTKGVTLSVAGSPVPNTTEATGAAVGVAFDTGTAANTTAVVFVNFTSPSGLITTYTVNVVLAARPGACP